MTAHGISRAPFLILLFFLYTLRNTTRSPSHLAEITQLHAFLKWNGFETAHVDHFQFAHIIISDVKGTRRVSMGRAKVTTARTIDPEIGFQRTPPRYASGLSKGGGLTCRLPAS